MTAESERLQGQLKALADDCEEQARMMPTGSEARAHLYRLASEARIHARDHLLGAEGLRLALDHCAATARFFAFSYGAPSLETEQLGSVSHGFEKRHPPADALNPRQLAEVLPIGERGARKAIERGYRLGRSGFYRVGKRWLATPDALSGVLRQARPMA